MLRKAPGSVNAAAGKSRQKTIVCYIHLTVFVTGRDRPRLEETGRRGAALGGLVMARVVDHRDDGQVEWLFAEIAAAAVARELAVVDADGHSPRPLGPDEA